MVNVYYHSKHVVKMWYYHRCTM